MNNQNLKLTVQQKYGKIAGSSTGSCCGSSRCCDTEDVYTVFSEDYSNVKGYNPDADMGLGCGLPAGFAAIKEGDNVLDLGSGAGNDCFVARALVGEKGKVTGLDFTDEMIEKARKNLAKFAYENIEFVKGDIEEMPFSINTFDIIISNCVLNLVPDKEKAFSEIIRVLKPGGHFCVSDVVLKGDLPGILRNDAEMYAGCISGAGDINRYLEIISNAGFRDVEIHTQKEIVLPLEIMHKYFSTEEYVDYKKSGNGIYSITVSAYK